MKQEWAERLARELWALRALCLNCRAVPGKPCRDYNGRNRTVCQERLESGLVIHLKTMSRCLAKEMLSQDEDDDCLVQGDLFAPKKKGG